MSITSDDFSSETIASIWQLEGSGASQNLATSGDEAYLELVVPNGTYNAWHTNTSVRSMQATDNEDFEVETRFLSAPSDDYQNQGILIEQDETNFIRFDVYHDGTSLHLFGAATTNGTSVAKFNITIPEGAAEYLRVTRSGNNWVFQYSADGESWSTAGSYNHSLNVTATGIFAAAQNDGFTAQVDYFFNTAEPIASEDNTIATQTATTNAPEEAPIGNDDSYSTTQDTALQITTPGVLDNDTDANGDTLSAVLISDVSNGTLTLNGDGSFNYTPDTGFYGADSFVYRADDGTGQSSDVTVTISVNETAGELASDDFSGASLDPKWSLEGPGGSASVQTSGVESYMELVVPTGTFNAWNTNTSVRAIQEIANGDLGLEARFLSNPDGNYQNHGILIEQDETNFIRFDVYHDGSSLHLFGATTSNGSSSVKFNITISEGNAEYLRVNRTGDSWTFEYSSDGVNWNTAGSYNHAMTVTGTGPFGASQSGGYTAEIDYFFNTASPISFEDGAFTPQEEAPVGTDDNYQTEQDAALVISADGVLANDTDANGDTLTAVLISDVSNGTLLLNSDGSFNYTPDSGYTGTDSFVYRADDGNGQSGDITVTLSVAIPELPPEDLVSDDFSGATLDTMWELVGSGASADLAINGDEKYLEITVPTGAFNAWRTNTAVRTLQDIADGDFSLETRFLSTPTGDYQNQGILVEENETTFVRFDVYHNGSSLYLFAATNSNESPTVILNTAIPAGAAEYLRVNRTGDSWTFEYSSDGINWTTAGTTNFAMNVTAAGPFAAAQNDGFVAQVDYFFNTASPVLPEDGIVTGGNSAPVGANDSYTTDIDAALIIPASGVLNNDSDANGDTLTAALVTDVNHGSLSLNSDGSFTYTPDAGFSGSDSFVYRADDGTDQSSDVTVTISVNAPAASLVSDDFNETVLAPVWSLEGPAGTNNVTTVGDESYLEIVVPTGSFNAWDTNTSIRTIQNILNEDFGLEARFLSQPTGDYQNQGILIEQDDTNFVRFDVYHSGTDLYLFAATTANGDSTGLFNIPIASGAAEYLRVDRSGNTWTFEYSSDGINWTTAGTTNFAINVTAAGPFASAQNDGFVAQVDYFFNTANPVTPEDPQPTAPNAADDLLTASLNTALVISISSDLLANDTDADGDTLSLDSFTQPVNGIITDNGDGTLTYTPANGFTGVDSFTYTISDGTFTDTATATIGVDNSAPVAQQDDVTTDEDTAINIAVLANDSDPDTSDSITVQSIGDAANGQVFLNSDGTVDYTPDENFFGSDTFTYITTDGFTETTGIVQVTVNSVEDDPEAEDDHISTLPGIARIINISLDLLVNDTDGDGDALTFQSLVQPANGTITDNGDGTLTYTPNQGFSGVDNFTYTVTDGNTTDSATVNVSVDDNSLINVWYGSVQQFGNIGEGQQWVNILGNVDTSQITGLSYSLNGGPERSLSIGTDTRRLEEDGDFNIDIDFAELDGSATNDIITIYATLSNGETMSRDIVIEYEQGNDWAQDYTINWASVTDLQDVVQIVDGEWYIDNGQLRTSQVGYDRIVSIGDSNWDNFEATMTMTINTMGDGTPRDGAGFGLGLLWNGHTDDPLPGMQPISGYNPIVSPFFNTKDDLFTLHDHPDWNSPHLDTAPFVFEEGVTYNIRVQVEQVNVLDRSYKFKIWDASQPEPEEWLLEGVDQMDEPLNGSLALIAHHWDISFGDITVTEIIGNDIIQGDETDEVLVAVNPADLQPGINEIDVLVGEGGADTFVLGDADSFYYDDGNNATDGAQDYALIYDFSSGTDQIQLSGEASDYVLGTPPSGTGNGTAIYIANASGPDELIGVVDDVTGLSLFSDDFIFVG